uniref:Uncharacterized protein n=1 Tax=Odontella aurita TaxID=265563 RepID=A0A7S4NJA0_9STRA|mmetsp:Transcript_8866/g.26559  ORF Transcript_8866/g.26559 Transcript_8866/m.26559 type:complete len:1108 (+) Transcript_8866:412-3735(+)
MDLRTRSSHYVTAPGGPASQVSLQRISNVKKAIEALQRSITAEERHKALRAAIVTFDHNVEIFHDDALLKHRAADILWVRLGFTAALVEEEAFINRPYGRSGTTADEVCIVLQIIEMVYRRCSIGALSESFVARVGDTSLALLMPMIQRAHERHLQENGPVSNASKITNVTGYSKETSMKRACSSLSLMLAIVSRENECAQRLLAGNRRLIRLLVKVSLLVRGEYSQNSSMEHDAPTKIEGSHSLSDISLQILVHLVVSRFSEVSKLIITFPDVLLCFGYVILGSKNNNSKSSTEERRYSRRDSVGVPADHPSIDTLVHKALQEFLSPPSVVGHLSCNQSIAGLDSQHQHQQHVPTTEAPGAIPGKQNRARQKKTDKAVDADAHPIVAGDSREANRMENSEAPTEGTPEKRKRGRPKKNDSAPNQSSSRLSFRTSITSLIAQQEKAELSQEILGEDTSFQGRTGICLENESDPVGIEKEKIEKHDASSNAEEQTRGRPKKQRCINSPSELSHKHQGGEHIPVLTDSIHVVPDGPGKSRGRISEVTTLIAEGSKGRYSDSLGYEHDGSFWLIGFGNDHRQSIIIELGEMLRRTFCCRSDTNVQKYLITKDAPAALEIVHICLNILFHDEQNSTSMALEQRNMILLQASGLNDSLAFALTASARVFHNGMENPPLFMSSFGHDPTWERSPDSTHGIDMSKVPIQSAVRTLTLALKALKKTGKIVSHPSNGVEIAKSIGSVLEACLKAITSLFRAEEKKLPESSVVLYLLSIVKDACSVLQDIISNPRDVNDDSVDVTRNHIIAKSPGIMLLLVQIAEGDYAPLSSVHCRDALEIATEARVHATAALASLSFVDDADAIIVLARTPRVILLMIETVLLMNSVSTPTESDDEIKGVAGKEPKAANQQIGTVPEIANFDGASSAFLPLLEGAAACLRNCSVVDRELCLSSRKRLVQALVILMSDDCHIASGGNSIKLRRFAVQAVHNFAAVSSNVYTLSKLGGQQLFATLSHLASSDQDSRTRLCASIALKNLAFDAVIAESMAEQFSTISSLAQAASSNDDQVGSHASDALHRVLHYANGTDLRQIMRQVASQHHERRARAISHDLMFQWK